MSPRNRDFRKLPIEHRSQFALFLVGTLVAVASVGCELVNNEDDFVDLANVTTISYSRHVQPLLSEKCGTCHSGVTAAAGLDLSSWESLVRGSNYGEAIVPFFPDRSPLLGMVERLVPVTHPLDVQADTLSSVEIAFLRRWIAEGAKNNGAVPKADADSLLYVAVQNEAAVYVIDTQDHVVSAIVDLEALGFSGSSKPHHVAVEPDGSYWYVSLIGESLVLKFDRENNVVGQAAFETPGMLALHPTQDFLYVGRSLSAPSPPSSIGRITRSSMLIEEVEVLFPRPHALVIDPTGNYVHTASLGQNRLMTVEAEGSGVDFTEVAGTPHAFVQHAVSGARQQMYTTTQLTSQLLVFDISAPVSITEIDAIDVNAGPWHPVITPDERYLYFGNNTANTITVVDLDQMSVDAVISGNGIALPHGSAVRGDGKYVYISNRNSTGAYTQRRDYDGNDDPGTVVVISTETNEIVKVLEVGRFAAGIATR